MNDLMVFKNEEFGEIRTIEDGGKILFCGSDVAKALGYSNAPDALQRHCHSDGIVKHDSVDSVGRRNLLSFITEGNLYRLITHSKLPSAERFERWVFDEVLPAIRRTGGYIAGQEDMTPEELMAKALAVAQRTLAEREGRIKALEASNSVLSADLEIARVKSDYFDSLVDRNLLTNFRETAKELGVKEKKFIGFLLEHKYVYRDQKGKLMPYAEKNGGLFEVKECVNEKTGWSGVQTLLTPRGRETFRLLCQGL